MDFDATSLYPSAMYNEKSVYTKIESRFAFKPYMKDVYLESINNQFFSPDGKVRAFLIIKYYYSPDLINEHLPVKEKVKNINGNGMRDGHVIDTLTSVDTEKMVEVVGKGIEIYEGVIYVENFKISPFGKVLKELFASGQKYKDKGNDLMQSLVLLIMNSLCGVEKRRDINEFHKFKSE